MGMKLAWLSHTRPDCLYEISQLAQITESVFVKAKSSYIRQLNKAVKLAVDNPVALTIPKLDETSMKVVGFSDSSFANNRDLSTQLGHIVFITDASGRCAPISFKSYKARRIVRSAIAGEIIAFSDMSDVAITISNELSDIFGRTIPVHLLTVAYF